MMGYIRRGNGGREFQSSLRLVFRPSVFLEQAQHFAVLEYRERGSEVAAAARAKRPAGKQVTDHGTSAHKNEQRNQKYEHAGQEIRRCFGATVERQQELHGFVLFPVIKLLGAIAQTAR